MQIFAKSGAVRAGSGASLAAKYVFEGEGLVGKGWNCLHVVMKRVAN